MREKNTYNEQFAKFALSCSLRSHHKANPTQKMATPLFALPTHHPKQENRGNAIFLLKKSYLCRY